MTVAEIATKLGGMLEGDGAAEITGLAGLRDAKQGDISFLSNPRYAAEVAETQASAVIVDENWDGFRPCPIIRVKNADAAFAALAFVMIPQPVARASGIHHTAVLAPDVHLGADVAVGPYCVLDAGVRIGDRTILYSSCYLGHSTVVGKDCRFYPYVSAREHTRIGDRVVIHNGAVIGSDGFGYTHDGNRWKKIPQVGIVEIGDDVEIGANVTIDRARFGKTVIGSGVKIDNLVQIAHNVRIGDNTAIAALVGIAGSTTIGKDVQLGGQAGVAGHLSIGDNTIVAGGAGVTKDVAARSFVSGFPAMPHQKAKRMHAHIMRLPQLKEKIEDIEERLARIEKGKESAIS